MPRRRWSLSTETPSSADAVVEERKVRRPDDAKRVVPHAEHDVVFEVDAIDIGGDRIAPIIEPKRRRDVVGIEGGTDARGKRHARWRRAAGQESSFRVLGIMAPPVYHPIVTATWPRKA